MYFCSNKIWNKLAVSFQFCSENDCAFHELVNFKIKSEQDCSFHHDCAFHQFLNGFIHKKKKWLYTDYFHDQYKPERFKSRRFKTVNWFLEKVASTRFHGHQYSLNLCSKGMTKISNYAVCFYKIIPSWDHEIYLCGPRWSKVRYTDNDEIT